MHMFYLEIKWTALSIAAFWKETMHIFPTSLISIHRSVILDCLVLSITLFCLQSLLPERLDFFETYSMINSRDSIF